MEAEEVNCAKHAAQKLLDEGNYLQSLEEFSKILVNHPNNLDALEGKVSACLELKLFHRCLKDIETLIQVNPCNTEVYNMAGQIYEEIGEYTKSIFAYLKAYSCDEDTENRPERVQKIDQLCSIILQELPAKIPVKNTKCLQSLVTLSERLADQEKFDVCLEMIVTAITSHCLGESAIEKFRNELNDCAKIDENITGENHSKTSAEAIVDTSANSKNMKIVLEQLTEREDTVGNSKVKTKEIRSSFDVNCKLDRLSKTPAIKNFKVDSGENCQKSSNVETNLKTIQEGKLNEESALRLSCISQQSSDELQNTDHADSSTKQPTQITFLPDIEPQTINEMLLQASDCSYRLGKLETSLWFANKFLQNSQTSEDVIGTIKAYSHLGLLHTTYGDHDFGILCYTKVRSKCREVLAGEKPLVEEIAISAIQRETTLKLCELFKDLELYEQAEEFLKKFFSKVEMVEQANLVKAYGILGEVELAQSRCTEAIKSFKTQLALCLKYDDQKGLVVAYSNLGKAYRASGQSKPAMEWFQLSVHTANAVNDPLSLATAYSSMGEDLLCQNNPQKASAYFEKQLDLATDIDQQTLRIQALFSLGKTYRDLRLFQHAEFFMKRALFEAMDLKMPREAKIIESLVGVLITLGKCNEGLKLLYEIRDRLEEKFRRIDGRKIVLSHPLIDKLNTCVDQILTLLVDEDKVDEAFLLAERNNCIVFNQMLAYKANVQGSEMTEECMNLTELYQVVSDASKIVLYYRVVRNGFMVWIIIPVNGMVHFHWYKAPIGSSFNEMVETLMNGLLQPADPLASYSCDHRKVPDESTAQNSSSSSKIIPQGAFSKDIPKSTLKSTNIPPTNDFLRELSKLFIFPIEEVLTSIPGMRSHDLVIVNSSFLSMIPFTDLCTSTGCTLAGLANSVQLLPCISILKRLEKNKNDPPKGISIIGNPEIKFPEMLAGFEGHLKPDFLEKEINDVAVLLGAIPNVGAFATKEHFLHEFSSSTFMHLATHGSHERGTIILAPVTDNDPLVVARDSWEITLEDIVACRHAPEVVVLTTSYGCRNRFEELTTFNGHLPLALMLAGVKTVVMATWSTPQNALLACLRQFYKKISDGLTVTCALSRAKARVRKMEEFQEPLYWASFSVYGRDSLINPEELRRSVAEASFFKAQKLAIERFELVPSNEGSSNDLLLECLMESVTEFLLRHHLHPTLLPILLQVTQEAITILQSPSPSHDEENATNLPYREITPAWVPLIRKAENFLISVGFRIKSATSKQTVLVYPYWNRNCCLEKVESLLQSVLAILTCSPAVANAVRAVLSREETDMFHSLRDMLQERLAYPYEAVQISRNALFRKFWFKRSTHRLMVLLGFREMGSALEFRNTDEDRTAVESCLTMLSVLIGFQTSEQIQPHPLLSQANLGASWMSYKPKKDEINARYSVAKSMDSIDAKYDLAINDVRKWHRNVLLTQAKVAESKRQQAKLDKARNVPVTENKQQDTSELPEVKAGKRQPLDLIKLGKTLTKVKVQSGSGPSSVRVPVAKEQPLPLVECMIKRHEATKNLYHCLGDVRNRRHEDIRKLLSL